MKVYLQVNPDTKVITDCIEYPYGNYIPAELEYIPQGIISGWFKYENEKVVEYPELKPVPPETEIDKLKERLKATEDALMMLMEFNL